MKSPSSIASFSDSYMTPGMMDDPNSTALNDDLAANSSFDQNNTINIELFETGGEGTWLKLAMN